MSFPFAILQTVPIQAVPTDGFLGLSTTKDTKDTKNQKRTAADDT